VEVNTLKSELNEIIFHLLVNQSTSLARIEKDLQDKKISPKEQIHFINKYLITNKIPPISIDFDGRVKLENKTREYLYHILKSSKFINLDYLSPEVRMSLVILLLLTSSSYYSLQDLADFVDVSKNTLLKDIKIIKERVKGLSVQVEYSRTKGYKIIGTEYNLRKLLVTELKTLLLRDFAIPLLEKKKFIIPNELFLLEQRLIKVEKVLKISFTDEQIEHLPIILTLLTKRMKAFNREWVSEIKKFDLENTKELDILKNIFWDLTDLSEKDKLYLALQVLSSNMLESALDLSRGEDLQFAVDEFLDVVEQNLAIELIRKKEIKEKLLIHLRPAIYRSWMRLNIQNAIIEQFIKEYSSLFIVISKSVYPLENFAGKPFSKEEIVYLAMHIQAWLYETQEEKEYVFSAIVVCRNGTSVSKFLLETLKGMFPNFRFLGAFAERSFKKYEKEVDFIFATVPLNTPKKLVIVKPILNKEDRLELKKQIRITIEKDINKKAKELVHYIKKYLNTDDYEKVSTKIVDFYQETTAEPVIEEHLHDTEQIYRFTPENILFTKAEMDWQDALNFALKSMRKRGSITKKYAKRVIELFANDSSRMMIGPSVYLPHAKPSEGVLKEDFSLLICKHSVYMPDGELAKMIVVIAPEDNNQHVPTLLTLNELFLDEQKSKLLFQATDINEILNLLNESIPT
jgi:transcriptional antiterminator/mannitol/fructose-specific phosphotransferase system IIA component (Ntr-type)